ncbi:aspartyl protease [Lacibacter cauensis]|uniref:Aspartyl protease n=1 Tax=Lacibacter cauensis TaxID=510947 RepID=A0A562SCE3_9BACT|nr:pepsin/retropepsin-like aspartic protease family protein [Lacibacter cauensis]TWI78424.1 aspartyl protease [Lacibacter cauensis]
MSSILPVKLLVAAAMLWAVTNGYAQTPAGKDSSRFVLSVAGTGIQSSSSAQSFTNDPVIETDSADFIIPFSRAGNLILIKAKADKIEGSFILDTGAPGLILNTTYFRDYQVLEGTTNGEQSGGITGSITDYGRTMIRKLSFGAVHYHKVEADRISLAHIENNKGIKIFGLLGVQLFKHFEMIIDYENSEIHLHHISKKEAKSYQHRMLNDTSAYSVFDIQLTDNKILTYGKVGGKRLTFLVDTGAESNVIDSRLSENILDSVAITRRITLNGAGNAKVDALYGDMRNFTIGERSVSTMPVLVTNMAKMCFSYNRCLDGMLGFDFLSMHKIGFNFVKRKMYIWK